MFSDQRNIIVITAIITVMTTLNLTQMSTVCGDDGNARLQQL